MIHHVASVMQVQKIFLIFCKIVLQPLGSFEVIETFFIKWSLPFQGWIIENLTIGVDNIGDDSWPIKFHNWWLWRWKNGKSV